MSQCLGGSEFSLAELPRLVKQFIVIVADIFLCILSTWLAFYLRLGEFIKGDDGLFIPALLSITIAIPVFAINGLYRAIFRYSGWPTVATISWSIALYTLVYSTIIMIVTLDGVPRTIGLIQPILLLLGVSSLRLSARFWLGGSYWRQRPNNHVQRVVIYGAGSTGMQLAEAINNSYQIAVVGFCDDNARLQGHTLQTLPIYSPEKLQTLIKLKRVSHVFLAMPSISRKRRLKIISALSQFEVTVRIAPSIADLTNGRVTINNVRDLEIEDLLGRSVVEPNQLLLEKNTTGKTILVTGAGGSIGSELCRQVIRLQPTKLLLVDSSEYALYKIHSELETFISRINPSPSLAIIPLLGSVQDETRMRKIIQYWKPETVYHAAAYKHVPIVEKNLVEGVKNNIFGTLNVARIAIEMGVENFVLISTDKAVRPTNFMGATKRLSELCVQALYAEHSNRKHVGGANGTQESSVTQLSIVRFGNVLDSSGSVIPKFREQIKNRGPVTLTHPDVVRYFMTIPEAAQLVIQAGALSRGGDILLLDMGEPVKIADLCRTMIELSGLKVRDKNNPEGDLEIQIVGLRPGEKLYEELLQSNEQSEATQHPKIFRALADFIPWDQLKVQINYLQDALGREDTKAIVSCLQQVVDEYTPSTEIADCIYHEKI